MSNLAWAMRPKLVVSRSRETAKPDAVKRAVEPRHPHIEYNIAALTAYPDLLDGERN